MRLFLTGGLAALAAGLFLVLLTRSPGLSWIGEPWFRLIEGLYFHLCALGFGFVPAFWLLRARALALLSALGFLTLGGLFAVQNLPSRYGDDLWTDAPPADLRVVSFNLLWTNMANGAGIAQMLQEVDADIVMVLEANPIADHMSDLRKTWPHIAGCTEISSGCNTLILSRAPLQNARLLNWRLIDRPRLVTAQLHWNGQPVTLVAAHLSKPYFDTIPFYELRQIGHQLRRYEGPLILAGDFNMPPWESWMRGFLQENQLHTAPYPVATWPVALGRFGVPIDHVFVRGGAEIAMMAPLPEALGSNHRGLIAEITLPKPVAARRATSPEAEPGTEPQDQSLE